MCKCLSEMRNQGILYDKSKAFAVEIIALCNELRNMGEYVMSKQILKSGTSIGANYCEALYAESPEDYVHKLSISLKEASETFFWLDILHDGNYLNDERYNLLKTHVEELYKMLNSSSFTVKQKLKR
ncbi:MAG: four helix bundle protein [Bacteroidales bacterium]|nr:four helix bundle protein [Bacteroidales bacterium]